MNNIKPAPSSSSQPPTGPLTKEEVQAAFAPLADQYPPILSLAQAAALAHYTSGSLKKLVSQDRFRASAIRGRPLRFWRDRFTLEVFNGATSPRRSAKPFKDETKAKPTDNTETSKR